jgi:hypothetical protein
MVLNVLDLQHEEDWTMASGMVVVAAFSVGGGWLVDLMYCVTDSGENPRLRLLARTNDGDVLDVRVSIIEVKLLAPSAILRGKPISVYQMMAALLRCSSLGGINLGGVHRLEGYVVDFLKEQCLSLAHRRRRVSAARCSGFLTTDIL